MEGVPQDTVLERLRKKLVAGEVAPFDFLKGVLELDQADPARMSSVEAADLLSRPEVVALCTTDEERTELHTIRSLSFFHRAQIRIMEGKEGVREDLAQALRDAEAVDFDNTDTENYLKATMAYLDNDLEGLKELATQPHLNRSLVENFIAGLEERGHPDYLADYAKERYPD